MSAPRSPLPAELDRVVALAIVKYTRVRSFRPGAWFGDGAIVLFKERVVLVVSAWGHGLTAWQRSRNRTDWERVRPVADVARRWISDLTLDLYDADSPPARNLPVPAPQLALKFATRARLRPELERLQACALWFEKVTAPALALAAAVPCRQWDVLQFLEVAGPPGEDLCRSNLPLAFMVSTPWLFHRPRPTMREVREAVKWKQRRIAAWLGLPDREAMVRIVRKVEISDLETGLMHHLGILLRHEPVAAAFGLLPRLTATLIRTLDDPRDIALLSPALMQELVAPGQIRGRGLLADTLQMLRRARQLRIDTSPCIRSLRHLAELHDELLDALRLHETVSLRVPFPESPFPGVDGVIEPVRTPEDLANEGRAMRHCVSSYADQVRRGAYAVYRVLEPERATLGLRRWYGHWQLNQLRAYANAEASSETREVVGAWLEVNGIRCPAEEGAPA